MQLPQKQLEEAAEVLKNGGLVAFPTDTLYALGAHAFLDDSVQKVYEAKGRPTQMALPLLVSSIKDISRVARDIPPEAWALADQFYPGSLTLVLRKADIIPKSVTAGRDTIAVRIPNHPIALALIKATDAPVIGTSANRSGKQSPANAEEVRSQLGTSLDMILDGGACPLGQQSTIVDLSQDRPVILREGAIPLSVLAEICTDIRLSQ